VSADPDYDRATLLSRQLERDDEIKHALRMAGIDPMLLSFEERQRKVLELAAPAGGNAVPAAITIDPRWLIDAADLLAEPDPGPTLWLVDGLIVESALVACVGRWKTTKSYALLHLCICIAAGRPAFGAFDVPVPGAVVFANEESGRTALWRRLDALARGSAIEREELRGRLMVAANARIRLDDPGWQKELVAIGRDLQPRLFALDPLARMKAAGRDENAQAEMGTLIEFIRELRDETGAAVAFVHHTGHTGVHIRGSSDLESVWESRLTWSRDGQAPLVSLASEHREAEPGNPISYRIGWDSATRSMRFELLADRTPELSERIADWLREHGPGTTDDVRSGVGVRRSDVQRTLETLERAGTVHNGPDGGTRRDDPSATKSGISMTRRVCGPSRMTGRARTSHTPGTVARPTVPPLRKGRGRTSHRTGRRQRRHRVSAIRCIRSHSPRPATAATSPRTSSARSTRCTSWSSDRARGKHERSPISSRPARQPRRCAVALRPSGTWLRTPRRRRDLPRMPSRRDPWLRAAVDPRRRLPCVPGRAHVRRRSGAADVTHQNSCSGRALTIASKRLTVVADKNLRVRRSKRMRRVATPELGNGGHLLDSKGKTLANTPPAQETRLDTHNVWEVRS
jgi:hypothetical protein